MTIRNATTADVDAIVAMGQRFLASVYADRLVGNDDAIRQTVTGMIENDTGLVLVGEHDGAPRAMFGGVLFAHPFSGERCVSDLAWWVDPEVRGSGVKLLKRAEQWAKDQGATTMLMVAPTEQVGRLYQRLGYQAVETSYQRRL